MNALADARPVVIHCADGSWLVHAPASSDLQCGAMADTRAGALVSYAKAMRRMRQLLQDAHCAEHRGVTP